MNVPPLSSYLRPEVVEALYKAASAEGVRAHVEEDPPKPVRSSLPNTLLAHGAGVGLGTLAGFGTSHLLNKAYQSAHEGKSIPNKYLGVALPVAMGGIGLAYSLARAHEAEEIRRARETAQHQPESSRR